MHSTHTNPTAHETVAPTTVPVGAAFASATGDAMPLLPLDLLLAARTRRFTRLSAFALQAPRGPHFRLQRSGAVVFKPRRYRFCGAFGFPI